MTFPDIGCKIVCVNDQFQPGIESLYFQLPVKDLTYTIRDYRIATNTNGQGDVSLLLKELSNPIGLVSALEHGFSIDRFKPVA